MGRYGIGGEDVGQDGRKESRNGAKWKEDGIRGENVGWREVA